MALLTKDIIKRTEKYETYLEPRLSIYGKKPTEWDDLAKWVKRYDLHKTPCTKRNLWLIQIPRVFAVFLEKDRVLSRTFFNLILDALYEVIKVKPKSNEI